MTPPPSDGYPTRVSAPIVLMHGSTQTSAGFAPLIERLQARGRQVFTVDLPPVVSSSPLECADRLAQQLPALVRPMVVAHSASGVLLPALAQRLGASRQVWLAAAVADFAGARSFADEFLADPTAVCHEEWIGVDPTTDPVLATYFLFHDTALAALRAALLTVQRFDLAPLQQAQPLHDPKAIPSTYLQPSQDRTLRSDWMTRAARERLGVEPVLVEGGHNCYAGHPDLIAAAIDDADRDQTDT